MNLHLLQGLTVQKRRVEYGIVHLYKGNPPAESSHQGGGMHIGPSIGDLVVSTAGFKVAPSPQTSFIRLAISFPSIIKVHVQFFFNNVPHPGLTVATNREFLSSQPFLLSARSLRHEGIGTCPCRTTALLGSTFGGAIGRPRPQKAVGIERATYHYPCDPHP